MFGSSEDAGPNACVSETAQNLGVDREGCECLKG